MLGGFLWCLGNMTVVPIVSLIGMSMGLLVWYVIGPLDHSKERLVGCLRVRPPILPCFAPIADLRLVAGL